VTIPLSADEARDGFDRVYALGIRQTTPDKGSELVERLLENHHYGQRGLSLLPVGTPTNNTEREASGFASRDDADASYAIERAAPLFDSGASAAEAADGLRLARAIGIQPATFEHVAHADGRDGADALLMNAVLWPATFGYALEELLARLFSMDTRDRIKAFALEHVCARGLVPGVRVGAQPYGVLPATAYSRFVPSTGNVLPQGVPQSAAERAARFNLLLRDVLLQMHADWTRIRDDNVAHAYNSGDATEAQQHFLGMLGLEPVSVGFDYRFALNCAGRNPSQSGLDFGIPKSGAGAASGVADVGPVGLLESFREVVIDALGLPPGPVLGDDGVSPPFEAVHRHLVQARGYKVRHMESPKALTGDVAGTDPSSWIGTLVATPPTALAQAARAGDSGVPRPLLFLLLRQALLVEYREAALRVLAKASMLTPRARARAGEADFFLASTLLGDAAVTRWSYLFAPLSQLDGRLDMQFPQGTNDLYPYMQSHGDAAMTAYLDNRGDNALFQGFSGHGGHQEQVAALQEHARLAGKLAGIAPARLEELFCEHVDMVSHRLDAWVSGLAHERLLEMRGAAATGVYVGAYGWVENLCPDPAHPIATGVPAALDGDVRAPIREDLENEGFVHAPSVAHATTAAILRGGYLAQASQPDVDNQMAVNLSSRRVRIALGLMDGVRAGNELGPLLGYRLERHLHDAYASAGVQLDELIAPLRRAFPASVQVDGSLGSPETAERQVVDGLALLETVNAWVRRNRSDAPAHQTLYEVLRDEGDYTGYPFDIVGRDGEQILPSTTSAADSARLDAVLGAIDAIADALDAIGDLVVGEGVHQIAQGNHARAAAVLAALTEGKAPPEPEIVDTTPRGTVVSHRLLLHVAPVDGRALSQVLVTDATKLAAARKAALPDGWKNISSTPRACAEPSLNRWLGDAIGAPDDVRLRVIDESGADVAEVTVADLDLQPIDLLAMATPGLEEGLAELSARALDTQRPADVDDEAPRQPLQVELRRDRAWGAEVKSLLELAPLLESASSLMTQSRPADAHDYLLAEAADPSTAEAPAADLDELEARARSAEAQVRDLGVRLLGLLSDGADSDPSLLEGDPHAYVKANEDVYRTVADDGTLSFTDLGGFWAKRSAFFGALVDCAAFGMAHSLPPTTFESRAQVARDLLERAQSAFADLAGRVQRIGLALDSGDPAGALRAAFGEAFAALPLFEIANGKEVAGELANEIVPDADATLDAWLAGVAAVRPAAASLADTLLLGDIYGGAARAASAFQLPAIEDEPWFGGEFPAGFEPSTDKLSVVVFGVDAMDPAGTCAGLMVDQWDEAIPDGEQTTGVAFNYDEPDSMPPQSLLLAVPPERRGAWIAEDLVQTLHDTLELAKNRAVELEHLHGSVYAQLLPAVLAEVLPDMYADTTADVAGSRAILDFGGNNPVPA
jgi:hypothetical protein